MPDCFVTLSCDVLPQIHEYERTSTTVINAYAGQPERALLGSLAARLDAAGIGGRVRRITDGCFTHAGIDPARKRFILIKSRQHFRAGFKAIIRHVVMVSGPRMTTSDYGPGATCWCTAVVEPGAFRACISPHSSPNSRILTSSLNPQRIFAT